MRPTLTLSTIALLFLMAASALGQTPAQTEETEGLVSQLDPMTAPKTPTSSPGENPIVLRVNGDPIYAIEISMVMQTIQSQLADRGDEVDQRELAQVATQRAIEQKVLVQEAKRFGIEADELQVARAAQIAEEQSGGRTVFEAKLKATGSSYEQFLGVIREIEIMKAFVSKHIEPNITVTDEEIAAYYEANPTLFDAEERVHAYHMIFIVREDADPTLLAAKREKAEAARQRAASGEEDFTVVARDLSEGPSAPTGGDLGWVTRGQLVSPLSETVFSLEPGQISEVIQSRFGFHVATISEHRPAERISLEEASPQVAAFLRQQKATEAVGELLETLLQNAKIENLIGGGEVGGASTDQ